jgi:hypothetical protein
MYVIVILIVFFVGIVITRKKENFNNNRSGFDDTRIKDTLLIKKTNSYNLIYKTNNFQVWEAEPIDNYFPIGQRITANGKAPTNDDTLINSDMIKARPTDFILISLTDDGYGVWRPVCHSDYGCLTDIISKQKPSKNRLKIVPKKYLKQTTISSINSNYESDTTKGFNLWDVHNSPYFYGSDLTNTKNNKGEIFILNKSTLGVAGNILVRNTSKFKKLYANTTKNYSIWRPIPAKNYRIIGDIITQNNINPNGTIEVITFYKSFTKPIIDYHDTPVTTIKDDDRVISLWNARCSKGHAILGHVVSFDNNEPLPNEIYSVPLEYLSNNRNVTSVANSIPDTKNKYSLWANTHFCIANNDYNIPSNLKTVNLEYCEFEKDILDISKEIILTQTSSPEIEMDNVTIKLIKNSLSQRTGVPEYRFKDISLLDDKIHLYIDSKPSGSRQNTIDDIIETLMYLLSKKNLSFQNDNITIDILDLNVNHNELKDKIKLNNEDYLKKV